MTSRPVAFVAFVAFVSVAPSLVHAQRDARDVAAEVHTRGGYSDGVRFESSRGGLESFPNLGGAGGESDAPRGARLGGGESDLDARRTSGGATGRAEDGGLGGLFGAASQLTSYVMLVVVGVALLVLLGFVVAALLRRRDTLTNDVAPIRPLRRGALSTEDLPLDLGDPDALAAQGRYADAILATLVLALKSSGWRPDAQRSRTAREVLFAMAPSDPRQPHLRDVVRRAERVRFAGEEATRELFEAVRADYALLRRHTTAVGAAA
jgi:hypothetical protein